LIESLAKAEANERAGADRARERQDAIRKREHERAEAELRELLDDAQRELADQRARTEAADNRVDQVLQKIRPPKPELLRVLMLGASSGGELRVAREQARIRAAVERALHRDLIDPDARPAATLEDLLEVQRSDTSRDLEAS
jgi:alkanesulfonate monooxygenase SsuD/methylene tetrahydromethanopterin reductase-like flavin-dependent oxidoreductase (luciferase family)